MLAKNHRLSCCVLIKKEEGPLQIVRAFSNRAKKKVRYKSLERF